VHCKNRMIVRWIQELHLNVIERHTLLVACIATG